MGRERILKERNHKQGEEKDKDNFMQVSEYYKH